MSVASIVYKAKADGRKILTEVESKDILEEAGIPTARWSPCGRTYRTHLSQFCEPSEPPRYVYGCLHGSLGRSPKKSTRVYIDSAALA